MTDKANTKCPLAILWRGHKNQGQTSGIEEGAISILQTYLVTILVFHSDELKLYFLSFTLPQPAPHQQRDTETT